MLRFVLACSFVGWLCTNAVCLADEVDGVHCADKIDDAIAKHRMGTIVVEAAPGTPVKIEQLRHEFWFGAALSNSAFDGRFSEKTAAKYKETFLANFNSAVTENAVKWGNMESRQGVVRYDTVEAILDWTDANNIPIRGHCIYWGVPNRVQPWLKAMDDDALKQKLRQRGEDVGRRFKGRFHEFDLNNEMLHADYYVERLGPDITKDMADAVHRGDREAVLFVNDYDILTGNLVDEYVKHIEGLLERGVPIRGIGVQGHLHAEDFDPEVLRASLDKLAKFDLPIRVTEFNIPGQRSPYMRDRSLKLTPEQEQRKAANLREYYRICFAHPSVTGILQWGFWEGACWIPASAMYRRDWTPTPAAEAYRDLVFEKWWTRSEACVPASGRLEIPAFYGTHCVTIGGTQCRVELKKADGRATVKK